MTKAKRKPKRPSKKTVVKKITAVELARATGGCTNENLTTANPFGPGKN
jgi:hypothetical protein